MFKLCTFSAPTEKDRRLRVKIAFTASLNLGSLQAYINGSIKNFINRVASTITFAIVAFTLSSSVFGVQYNVKYHITVTGAMKTSRQVARSELTTTKCF